MAKLSDEQAKQLKELQELAEAPDDDGGSNRVVNMHIDFSDSKAVKLAQKMGLLSSADIAEIEAEGEGEGEGEEEGEGEGEEEVDTPRRRSYF